MAEAPKRRTPFPRHCSCPLALGQGMANHLLLLSSDQPSASMGNLLYKDPFSPQYPSPVKLSSLGFLCFSGCSSGSSAALGPARAKNSTKIRQIWAAALVSSAKTQRLLSWSLPHHLAAIFHLFLAKWHVHCNTWMGTCLQVLVELAATAKKGRPGAVQPRPTARSI